MSKNEGFFWEVLEVLQANGFSEPRARKLYLEIEEVIEKQLLTGQLRIRGLVTLSVSAILESTRDGWTGERSKKKFVVRVGAAVGNRLKKLMTDRAKFAHGMCPLCDKSFDAMDQLREHMSDHPPISEGAKK